MFFDSVRWTALLTLLVTFGAAQEEEGMSTFVFYVAILVVFFIIAVKQVQLIYIMFYIEFKRSVVGHLWVNAYTYTCISISNICLFSKISLHRSLLTSQQQCMLMFVSYCV